MDIDTSAQAQKKQLKFDNLYDILFNNAGQTKENVNQKLSITGDRLDFLETHGDNIKFEEVYGG